MFDNKFITIGAIALMFYCIYEYRTTNYQVMPDQIYPAGKAKYNINWDIDDSKPNRSMTEKFLNFIFANKIEAIKNIAANNSPERSHDENRAAIGDKVNLTYTITQDDQTSKTNSIEGFVLRANDPLTQFLLNMEPNKDKLVILEKGSAIPAFAEITGQKASMLISIKSLTKTKN